MSDYIPPANYSKTGVMRTKDDAFLWTICHFDVVLLRESLVNGQRLRFENGEDLTHVSTVFLRVHRDDENQELKSVRFHYQVKDCTPGAKYFMKLEADVGECDMLLVGESGVVPVSGFTEGSFPLDDPRLLTREHLVLHVQFQLQYELSVQGLVDELRGKLMENARSAVATLLHAPNLLSDAALVAKDGQEYLVHMNILQLRCPKLAELLANEYNGTGSGPVKKLDDISAPALNVLLRFIYCGELLPDDWSQGAILPELVNAASKYKLEELLPFFDAVLGKVANQQNAPQLYALACQMSLETAKEELLKFMGENGGEDGATPSLATALSSVSLL